jgi:hypothetical protein
MKSPKIMKSLVVLTLALAIQTNLALARQGSAFDHRVAPPPSHPYGRSYGEWSAAWWQWAVSFPLEVNPLLDTSGASCGLGQSGPVWFLAGSSGSAVTRSCAVPNGTAIFFPLINFANDWPCPDPNFGPAPGQTMEQFLTEGANGVINHVTALSVELDGAPLQNLFEYRATSELFYFTLDASLIALDPCATGQPQPVVSDGYWIMLRPLPPGVHTLHFTGTWVFTQDQDGFDWTFTVDVSYVLTVSSRAE